MNVLIVSVSKKSAQLLSKTIQRLSQQPDNIDVVVGLDDFLNYLNNNEDPELIFNICDDEEEDLFSIYSKKQVSSALVFFARNDRYMASSFLFNTLYFYTA